MSKRLDPGHFKDRAISFLSILTIFLLLFSCTLYGRFTKKFIADHAAQIGESKQLVFATNRDPSSSVVTVHTVEKNNGVWQVVLPKFAGSIGGKGFAAMDDKREGDSKSPTGVFPLVLVFGYDPSVETKMPYRQATEDDFWVDDADAQDYNKWVKGKPNAASWEKMRRDDDRYKYGVVIGYNMDPIVKGKGSAIFLHVWKDGGATLGCVSVPEEMVLKILGWLDPAKKPLIVMGAESELSGMKPR